MSGGARPASCLAALLAIAAVAPARADCKLRRLLELPVTMVDMHPMVTARVNGIEARFIADSGAFYSMLSGPGAAELKLKTYPAPWGLGVSGIGGEAHGLSATLVKDFSLAGLAIHNIEFLVGGGDLGGGGVGVLGQNVFEAGDVEYDLANGVIRLMREQGCEKTGLAYWAAGTTQTYSVMDIGRTTKQTPHTTGVALLNGVKIRVMFDTGAYSSLLTKQAAERAGIKMNGPGVVDAGAARGVGRETVRIWVAPFQSFKLGDEEIRNTRLRIEDASVGAADMLLGADFFLSHRVYVASGQHKLYFTYNGGPVFNLGHPAAAASGTALPGPTPPDAAPGPGGPGAPGAAPNASGAAPDASDFSRRGNALAARRDFVHAIAELTRACELAPDHADYFYERGLAELESRQAQQARADFDRVLELQPGHVPGLMARADLELQAGGFAAAAADLDAADRSADRAADARLRMAFSYAEADRPAQALAQLDAWIDSHRDDARLPQARSERCWVLALGGQDPAAAVDDCNAALKRLDKSTADAARVFDGRGLARLRLGDYAKSMTDFDAALAVHPKDPWALYGRGLDRLRRGDTGEGQADLAAATALWPPIAGKFPAGGQAP